MIVVVAGSFAETAAFARQNGLRNVSHVVNRDKIKGMRPATVHLLPGYWTRRDIHAINAELANIRRQRPTPEFVEWQKIEGTFVRGEDADDVVPSTYAIETPAPKNALETDVIAEVQASQLAALTSEPADDDDADDADDFFSMLDSAANNG